MQRNAKSGRKTEELLKLRDAALQLGISFPTIKQWIYKKKIRSIRTAGGHPVPRCVLGRVDGFDENDAAGERDEGGVVLGRFLAA